MSNLTINAGGSKLSAYRGLFLLYSFFTYCVTLAQAHVNRKIKTFAIGGDISTWQPKLDHFNDSDLRTFNQKYMLSNKFWKPGGPVFLYIEGEGPMSGGVPGYVIYLAQKHHALIASLEHRYYGYSVPFDLQANNLQWLSVKQALADLNSFTDFIKTKYQTGPWVCFGGSYAGALSAWYRVAYPHATVGALASSAVVHSIVAFKQYDRNVRQAVSPKCATAFDTIRQKVEEQASTPEGLQKLLALYNCESDTNLVDFFTFIADIFNGAVQYSEGSQMCHELQNLANNSNELVEGYSEISENFWGKSFCRSGFYNTMQMANISRWDPQARAWEWQTCSELGWFSIAPRINPLESKKINLQYFLQRCAISFGKPMLPASWAINQETGGKYPKAKNVFFSNGISDPWKSASVARLNDPSLPSYLMDCADCGHCRDLDEPRDDDSPALKRSRAIFEVNLNKWLKKDAEKVTVANSRRFLPQY